jgi:hypothetical protein
MNIHDGILAMLRFRFLSRQGNSENAILPVFGAYRPFIFMNIHEGMLALLRFRFLSLGRDSENAILPVLGAFRSSTFMNIHEVILVVLRFRFSFPWDLISISILERVLIEGGISARS